MLAGRQLNPVVHNRGQEELLLRTVAEAVLYRLHVLHRTTGRASGKPDGLHDTDTAHNSAKPDVPRRTEQQYHVLYV